jgi:hypothetical protein
MQAKQTSVSLDNQTRLLECVRSGLSTVGETGAEVVLFHIESQMGLKTEEIPDQPVKFVDSLGEIFGEGAKPIVMSILRELLLCSYRGVEYSELAAALTGALASREFGNGKYLQTTNAQS